MGVGVVICLERGAVLLQPTLPLTVSCFSKIQIGFKFLAPAHLGCPGQRPLKGVQPQLNCCVCKKSERKVEKMLLKLEFLATINWHKT